MARTGARRRSECPLPARCPRRAASLLPHLLPAASTSGLRRRPLYFLVYGFLASPPFKFLLKSLFFPLRTCSQDSWIETGCAAFCVFSLRKRTAVNYTRRLVFHSGSHFPRGLAGQASRRCPDPVCKTPQGGETLEGGKTLQALESRCGRRGAPLPCPPVLHHPGTALPQRARSGACPQLAWDTSRSMHDWHTPVWDGDSL